MLDQTCPWSFLQHQNNEFCERELCSWVVQPGNTWTNIIYLIVAIMILRTKHDHTRNERFIFGISTLVLFVGSTFFHMSGSHLGWQMDIGSMFLLSMGILSLAIQRTYLLTYKPTIALFAAGFLVSLLTLFNHTSAYITFGMQVLIGALLEFRMLRSKKTSLDGKLVIAASLTLILAFLIWIMDRVKVACIPDNHILPAHGVWHLLAGTAIYLLFKAKKAET